MIPAAQALAVAEDRLPNESEIRAELDDIFASAAFAASARNCNFLRYVVAESGDRRASDIEGQHRRVNVFSRAAALIRNSPRLSASRRAGCGEAGAEISDSHGGK